MNKNTLTSSEEHNTTAIVSTPTYRPPLQPSDHQGSDQQTVVNQAAIDLLESWQVGDEQEQRDTWEYLKRVLEEDRLSNRTLLP